MANSIHCFGEFFGRASLLAALWVAIPGLLYGQEASPAALPPGDGKDLVAVACTQCHGLKPIVMLRDGLPGWRNMVQEMVLRGAQLLPEEAETVTQYLAKNYGPTSTPSQTEASPGRTTVAQTTTGAAAKAVSLPPGPGKELVENRCALCHDLGKVTTVKRTRPEWERITKDMVERGTQVTSEEIQDIISYLSSQFGKEAK